MKNKNINTKYVDMNEIRLFWRKIAGKLTINILPI